MESTIIATDATCYTADGIPFGAKIVQDTAGKYWAIFGRRRLRCQRIAHTDEWICARW